MKEYDIFVGLKQSDMKTTIPKAKALGVISKELAHVGVEGFNVSSIDGYWNGKPEKTLNINFINTFKVNKTNINKAIDNIKNALKQESILIKNKEIKKNDFHFY